MRLLVFLGVFFWIVLRGIQGAGAVEECEVSSECASLIVGSGYPRALTLAGDGAVEPGFEVECDGSTFAVAVASVISIAMWEISKKFWRWVVCREKPRVDCGCQTTEFHLIPMPLQAGVPHRAHILYSLWRAGYPVHVEGYPGKVRRVFEGLVGDWLVRNEEGNMTSPSSSGSSQSLGN